MKINKGKISGFFACLVLWLLAPLSGVLAQASTVSTLAGNSIPLDGIGTKAHFGSPWQIQVKDTLAFISDKDNNALRTLSLKTKRVQTLLTNQNEISGLALSSTGDTLYFCTDRNVLKRYIRNTQALTILDTLPDLDIDAIACKRNGALLIGSASGHRIAERSVQGVVKTLAGKLNTAGFVEGLDTIARFNRIASIILSQTEDTIYISDRFNSKIRRFIPSTKQVSTLATGNLVFGPRQLAFSKRKDTIFIANSSNHSLVYVPLKVGAATVFAGATATLGYVDGNSTVSRYYFPLGIARSDSGWIVCDNANRRIRMVKKGISSTIAGIGIIGDGTGIDSRFNGPYDLVKHPFKDSIYITDQTNHAIRIMDLTSKIVSTAVGNGISGNVSGAADLVRLNRPTNMAMSPSGDTLFFVEPFANKVKYLLTKTNQVKWLAGSDTVGFRDYPFGKYARFNRPQDLAYRDGKLYIADALNHKIRVIKISTTAVSTFSGTIAGFKDSTLLGCKYNRPATLEWVGNRLFIGEDAGLKIRVLIPEQDTVMRWAGSGNIGTVDGPGDVARFKGIFKISYDPFKRGLLVGGYLNEGVCRFVSVDTMLVSTFMDATGFQDGAFSSSKFLGPLGFWADEENTRLVFADAGNNRIRSVNLGINRKPNCTFDTSTIDGLNEDQALVTFLNVVSNISPGNGPVDNGQLVSISVESVPPGKITNGIVASGALRFKPAPDSNGTFLVKVKLKDNGGTLGGGVDSSVYFKTVRVKAINDAPILQLAGNDTASNGVARARAGFVLKFTPGPHDELWQQIVDTSIVCDRPDWFSKQPWFDQDTLKYEPISDTLGTCSVFIKLKDNGGIADGGKDSLETSFTITLLDPSSTKTWVVRPSLVVYPNPATRSFRVRNMPAGFRKISLFDMRGILMEEIQIDSDGLFRLQGDYTGLFVLKIEGAPFSSGLIQLEGKSK